MTDEMIMLWINIIGITILALIGVIESIYCIKRYFPKTEKTGEYVMTLSKSHQTMLKDGVVCVGIIIIMSHRFIAQNRSGIHMVIFSVLMAEILIMTIIIRILPQRIYENGILLNTGFIEWSDIQSVKEGSEADEKIMLRLRKQRYGTRDAAIYCLQGMRPMLEEYIKDRI